MTEHEQNPYRQPVEFAMDDDVRDLRVVGKAVSIVERDDVTPSNDEVLAVFAETINREHAATNAAVIDALTHAVACGEALLHAHQAVPKGQWTAWLDANVIAHRATASRYMRLAAYKEFVPADNGLTVDTAMRHLRTIAATRPPGGASPKFDVDKARLLRSQGLSYKDIGFIVGASGNGVSLQLNPTMKAKFAARQREIEARRTAERRALRTAERQAEHQAVVSARGGKPADAYALLRKCAQALDMALEECNDTEQRQQMRAALSHTHKAEDAIVRALRIGRQS